jgi:pSer/pThr/pTyr-binding forkhead associated (FHA) protein
MPITVKVLGQAEPHELTFDGLQRVVIGRGASSDVRLPDPSVSHRHASVQASGSGYVLVDERSTNGTFVGEVKLAARTSRMLRSGDRVRVGRVWLEIRLDESAPTRDLGQATRDLALALVAGAMRTMGESVTVTARVVEGPDMGAALALEEEGRAYLLGRGPDCDLLLSDPDGSREHVQLVRRGGGVLARDLGSKNGAVLGEVPLPSERDTPWRPAVMMRVGRNVFALVEPVVNALAELEDAPDEPLAPEEAPLEPPGATPPVQPSPSAPDAPVARTPRARPKKGASWTAADVLVMLAALSVLALSIAGLVWLLRA